MDWCTRCSRLASSVGSGPGSFRHVPRQDVVMLAAQPQQAPPEPPVIVDIGPQGPVIRSGGSPSATYEALRHSREELGNQLERLEDQRDDLTELLAEPNR